VEKEGRPYGYATAGFAVDRSANHYLPADLQHLGERQKELAKIPSAVMTLMPERSPTCKCISMSAYQNIGERYDPEVPRAEGKVSGVLKVPARDPSYGAMWHLARRLS